MFRYLPKFFSKQPIILKNKPFTQSFRYFSFSPREKNIDFNILSEEELRRLCQINHIPYQKARDYAQSQAEVYDSNPSQEVVTKQLSFLFTDRSAFDIFKKIVLRMETENLKPKL